jgi:hypothetical protein
MRHFSYDSDLTGGSLMVRESRVIADLLLKEATSDEWLDAIQTDNRLQKPTAATARRIAQSIRKRLERMEPSFWQAIRDGDDELATQASFCAVLERNLLLVEFIESVLRDAFVTQAGKLHVWQWNDFLDERAHKDSALADWSMTTKRKTGQVAFRILAEVGLLTDTRSLTLQHLLVRPEVRVLLDDTYRHRIRGCLEVSGATAG